MQWDANRSKGDDTAARLMAAGYSQPARWLGRETGMQLVDGQGTSPHTSYWLTAGANRAICITLVPEVNHTPAML